MSQEFKLSKNVYYKICDPKLIFLNEKKNQKNSVDFRNRKLTLKVRFWHSLTTRDCVNSQNKIIFSEDIDFWSKKFLILYPFLENSTTHITLKPIEDCSC